MFIVKRYRVLSMDFDSGPSLLTMEIRNEWDESVKEQHRKNQEQVKQELIHNYGPNAVDMKLHNYIDLGPKPMSILAFHNKFFEQIRSAFIVGSYYPALTGACTLGERILNHLIHSLRENFKATPEYKRVYNKDSFDDWEFAITVLESWGVLLPEVAAAFIELAELRHSSIHFNPAVDKNERHIALQAIKKLGYIINRQFGSFGNQPWFIPGIRGASYLKREVENNPFIKKIYIPNCHLVGPSHKLEFVSEGTQVGFQVHDDEYEDREISDEEFRYLVNK